MSKPVLLVPLESIRLESGREAPGAMEFLAEVSDRFDVQVLHDGDILELIDWIEAHHECPGARLCWCAQLGFPLTPPIDATTINGFGFPEVKDLV